MTNRTTGIQVAPIAEADLMSIRSKLAEFLAYIDSVASLPATVRDLQTKVDNLSLAMSQADTSMAHAAEQLRIQAETIAELKMERDTLTRELRDAIATREAYVNENTDQGRIISGLNSKLAKVTSECETAELSTMVLQDELATANARIKQANEYVSSLTSLFRPAPKPEVPPIQEVAFTDPPLLPEEGKLADHPELDVTDDPIYGYPPLSSTSY